MPITMEALKTRAVDYLLASIEDGQLVMEPFCSCGTMLDENYQCPECNRTCSCRFVACEDPRALAIVEKLLSGNPVFRDYEATLIIR